MMKRNQVDLRFSIWNFEDLSHSEISDTLGLLPQKVYIKGEFRNPKNTNPDSPRVKKNGWILNSGLDEYAPFEHQMNNLLDILEPRIDTLKEISVKYLCEFSCALHVYRDNGESTPSVHLDERYNNFIKEVNVEFDLDLYVV